MIFIRPGYIQILSDTAIGTITELDSHVWDRISPLTQKFKLIFYFGYSKSVGLDLDIVTMTCGVKH